MIQQNIVKNKTVKIILWILFVLVFLVMLFVLGYLKGANDLSDKFMTISYIIGALSFAIMVFLLRNIVPS